MVITSYAASRRVVLLGVAVLSTVAALVCGLIDLLTMRGLTGAVLFAAVLGIGAFYAYYFGFHQVYLVELTPVELRWRRVLRDEIGRASCRERV